MLSTNLKLDGFKAADSLSFLTFSGVLLRFIDFIDFLVSVVDGRGGGISWFVSNFLIISSKFVHLLALVGGGGGGISWGIFWGGVTCFLVDFWTPWCLSIEIDPANFKKTFWPNCGWFFFSRFLVVFNFRDSICNEI